MALSILWLPGWSGAGASERTPPGVPRRLRGGGAGSRCTRYPPGRSSGGSGEDLPRRPLRSPRPLALRRSAWLGLPEFADGARGAAAPGPAPGRRPAPGPAHAGPLSGPRPGPRPSAAAPLARSAPRACPQAPAGSAPPPGGSSSSGTRPPRPLGNRLPGARAPPPAPTPGTEPTCAGVCGVPVPPCTPSPAQRRALSAWGDRGPGAWGLGEARASRGGPDPAGEAEAGGRARVVILWCGLVHALLLSRSPRIPFVPPGRGRGCGVSRCRP